MKLFNIARLHRAAVGFSTANSGSDRERPQGSFLIYCAASARSRQSCSSFSSFFFSSGSTQSFGQPFIFLRFGLVVVRFGQHGGHPFREISRAAGIVLNAMSA